MLGLVKPSLALMPSYLKARREGNFTTMQPGFGNEPIDEIEKNPEAYLNRINNTKPYRFTLVNGKEYSISDHELLWITDGQEFFGTVALRYAGDDAIINEYAGHIGMAIRPALLNRGYGIRTIKTMFNTLVEKARSKGLDFIYATCDPENKASMRLIEYFGGQLEDKTDDLFGTDPNLRYKINLVMNG